MLLLGRLSYGPEPHPCWFNNNYKKTGKKIQENILIANTRKSYIIVRTLGHSLMVELRTLTPLVLVRIQLPQPRLTTVQFHQDIERFSY